MRALAIVDGEHYPPVVRAALEELPYEFVVAHLVGGTEKLRAGADYGVPVAADLDAAIAEFEPELVVDLSDEPVLGPERRFRTASRVLARGLPYLGADFRLEPPTFLPCPRPSLAVIGTGKRVGKTAVTGYLAQLFAAEREVVVVAMGRGGPPEPELVELPPTLERLLELSRAGRHAASDYLETAALAQVPTVGCTRCGGGLAGMPAASNVEAGLELALAQSPDLLIFDGSGAAIPPVATAKRVLAAGANQPPELVAGYLNTYRILISDLVLLTLCEDGAGHEQLVRAVREVKDVRVVPTVLRPRPVEDVSGRRVAFFTTAPAAAHEPLARHLREAYGADVVHVSGNLARRDALAAELERVEAELYLVEIKAAAIDVVAEAAARAGIRVVFADNDVLPLDTALDLEAELRALAEAAAEPIAT
jgi:cyclic 2,3-diphosphoglycerate synthetase